METRSLIPDTSFQNYTLRNKKFKKGWEGVGMLVSFHKVMNSWSVSA